MSSRPLAITDPLRNVEKGEAPDLAFQREYWEPCNSTFREYISWGCTGN